MEFEALENSNAMAAGGAGISTAQMIAGKGVEVVLTGNCGPNAYQVLSAAGLQVITGISGRISDAIQAYKSGQFQSTSQPTVEAHFGMGATPGMGAGTGFGMRGGGMGRGRGMSRGMGGGMGAGMMPPVSPTPQSPAPGQELEALRAQSQALAQQLAEIQRHIEELEEKRR